MQTWIDLKFADGEYTFRLGLAQIAEIERKADTGIGAVYARCVRGRVGAGAHETLPHEADFRYPELVEVVRQGLIGGGAGVVDGVEVKVSTVRANDLIAAYVIGANDQRMPMRDLWALAFTILYALIEGYSPPGGAEPAKPAAPTPGST